MRFGLAEPVIAKIQALFARFPEVQRAILYGSRAKGNFKPGSDIDLTLHGESLSQRVLNQIAADLDDLLLPYTFDLSIFAHIENANLREHIERVGKLFYEKKSGDEPMRRRGVREGDGEIGRIL